VDDYDFIGEVRQAFDEFRGTLGPGDGVATVPSYRGEGLIFKARPFPSWVVDLGGRGL
jgi:hypothetical protein